MKQGYFVTDDGMVAEQGIRSLSEAKRAAESIIQELPFGDIGRFEILLRGDGITKVMLRWEPVIDWEVLS